MSREAARNAPSAAD